MPPIKIVVADDHGLFRAGIVNLLSSSPDILVIAEAEDGEQLYNIYFDLKPDVILVDISMPRLSGILAVKRIVKKDKFAKALFLSMYDDEEYVYACFKAGGVGFANKNISKEELIEAIEDIYAGRKYYRCPDCELISNFSCQDTKMGCIEREEAIHNLTKREKDILRFIDEGLTSVEMGEKLFVSKRTIDKCRSDIMQKLNLHNLPELIKFAIEYNILYRKD